MHRKSNREKPPLCGKNVGSVAETRPGQVDRRYHFLITPQGHQPPLEARPFFTAAVFYEPDSVLVSPNNAKVAASAGSASAGKVSGPRVRNHSRTISSRPP